VWRHNQPTLLNRAVLDTAGFTISAGVGQAGDNVIERAFVEK
jgi:hypothetical protein